ncbi:P-loop containing nucleoside triphosphate hydrolase protein [Dioscorea alata]|uniref:P-loop containing nucleoside triphosphate hydrolase protein n=1 Tax=Dioscorea alata TaxID=55571 RepID=A0ACB7WVY4_DIOAL|nr:P-loop containing nucleoside triphosphate hydrolase protein [Dioscorea alata]
MASGLKKDDVVILRLDGEELKEFSQSPSFDSQMLSIFNEMKCNNSTESMNNCILMALEKLTVDHGMPPVSDSWVFSNVVEPALQSVSRDDKFVPVSEEIFLEEFRKVVNKILKKLQEKPLIIAHSETNIDGSGIKTLLSDKNELRKTLALVWKDLTKDDNKKNSVFLRAALDRIFELAELPSCYASDQIDAVMNANEKEMVKEEEFKETMTEILKKIMQQLERNPILMTSNSVVHEPMNSSTNLNSPLSLSESE